MGYWSYVEWAAVLYRTVRLRVTEVYEWKYIRVQDYVQAPPRP